MSVGNYADTSAVKILFGQNSSVDADEYRARYFGKDLPALRLAPVISESFQVQKETKMSTAISNGRRTTKSKNVKGTSGGSFGLEFALDPLNASLLAASVCNSWATIEPSKVFSIQPTLDNFTVVVSGGKTTVPEITAYVFDGAVKYDLTGKTITAKIYVGSSTTEAYTYTNITTSNNKLVIPSYELALATATNLKVTISVGTSTKNVLGTTVATSTNGYSLVITNSESKVLAGSSSTEPLNVSMSLYKDGVKVGLQKAVHIITYTIKSGDDLVPTVPVISDGQTDIDVSFNSIPDGFVSSVVEYSLKIDATNSVKATQTVGTIGSTVYQYVTDATDLRPYVFGKVISVGDNTFYENYYGQCVNELTLDMATSDFMKLNATLIGTYGETLDKGVSSESKPAYSSTIVDTANNIKNLKIFDSSGNEIPLVFSTASLKLSNNMREQPKLGDEFSAAIGLGKFSATLTGEAYYYSNDILKKHLSNANLSALIEIYGDGDDTLKIHLPKLSIAPAQSNAGGENQDYKISLTLNAMEGVSRINYVTGAVDTVSTAATNTSVSSCSIAMYRKGF